jgi:pyruvate dehydrogenase (quinone)
VADPVGAGDVRQRLAVGGPLASLGLLVRRQLWRASHVNAAGFGAHWPLAEKAFPNRQVVSLSGDGGFTMLMGDFVSFAQLKLLVKVVVFNNGTLGFVELEQKSTGFLTYEADLNNPNFATFAQAIGIRGIHITNAADVDDGLADALAHDGPVLVDAVVARTELAMPPAVTVEMVKGFALYTVKAIMRGRADEIIDLAKTNLWR